MGILFSDFHRTGILVHPHACVFFFFWVFLSNLNVKQHFKGTVVRKTPYKCTMANILRNSGTI